MKMLLVCAVAAVALHLGAEDGLLILKDGTSIVAREVLGTETAYNYKTVDGKQSSVTADKVSVFLPKVDRGRDYTAAAVRQRIATIRQARKQFPKLQKQTGLLLAEWLTLEKQMGDAGGGLEAKYKEILDTYAGSGKTPADFNKLTSGLGMLKYEDVQGTLGRQIDTKLGELKQDFLAVNQKKLAELAGKTGIRIHDYAAIDALATALLKTEPTAAQKKAIVLHREKARTSCYRHETARIDKGFRAKPTINSYLRANTILYHLEIGVANATYKEEITKKRKELQSELKAYNFGIKGLQDFPLHDRDMPLLRRLPGDFRMISHQPRPAALIFPADALRAALDKPKIIRFRVVFRRRPPKRLGYVLVFGPNKLLMPYPQRPPIKNAHMDIPVSIDFTRFKGETLEKLKAALAPNGGVMVLSVELVEVRTNASGNNVFKSISNSVPVRIE